VKLCRLTNVQTSAEFLVTVNLDQEPMKHKAILFDLDGTLLDTLDDLADSANAALARNGLATHPVDAYRQFVGDGVVSLMRRAVPSDDCVDDERIDKLVAEMRKEYAWRWDAKTKPYEGVAQLLDGLVQRGVKMGILSNKPHDMTALCVSKLLPNWRFDAVIGVSDDVAPKPEVPPAEFLYLGDTDTDMKTATAAGMFAVGALWGFRDREELLGNGAKVVIARPTELLGLL